MKKAIIKGFGDRTTCDKDILLDEPQNLDEIVMENEYKKEKIKEYLSEKQPRIEREEMEISLS